MDAINYLEKNQIAEIGLDFVFSNLKLFTPMARNGIKKTRFYGTENETELIRELNNIGYSIKNIVNDRQLYSKFASILTKLKDINGSIKNLEENRILDIVELFELKIFCFYVNRLKELLDNEKIDIDGFDLYDLKVEYSLLDPDNLLLPTFMIYDSYSEALSEVRHLKKSMEVRIRSSEDPLIYQEVNQKRKELVYLEETHEYNVRKELSGKLSKSCKKFFYDIKALEYLDILIAKSKMAAEYSCIKPVISKGSTIDFEDLYNPYYAEIIETKGNKYTPVSISLKKGSTILTGANMGGKSLTLKTIVLNTALSQMGFYIFAKSASIPSLNYIHMISEDMQSVKRGLSSFGAEIKSLDKAISSSNMSRGLIVMDELARGTNPSEGKAIVSAAAEFLNRKDSFSIISTHYDGINLKGINRYKVIGLKNIDFDKLKSEFKVSKAYPEDVIQSLMDYRLEKDDDDEVPKDALNICQFLGLNEEMFELIKNSIRSDKLEKQT